MADLPRPHVHRGALRCPPAAAGGTGSVIGGPADDRPYDRSRTFFRAEEDFPGPRTMRASGGLAAPRRPGRRTLLVVRGRVRPARAVRHARAVARALRPRLGGRDPHLAPVRRRRGGRGAPERTRGPAHPGQLRRQAQHDRPLGRRGLRGVVRPRAVGQHGRHRVHGPRALPRREGHLGQARASCSTSRSATSPCSCTGPASPAAPSARRSPPTWTSTPPSPTCSAWRRPARRTACLSVLSWRGRSAGPGVGHRRRLRELGAGHRRPPQVRPRRRRGELPPHHVVQPVVDHARPRLRGRGPAAAARPAGPARLHARVGHTRHRAALRAR